MVKRHFSTADKARITAAIHAAEANTSGEFVAVVARSADHYLFAPLVWAAVLALLLPGVVLLASVPIAYERLYHLQLAVFIVIGALFLFVPGLHMHLIPRHVRHSRASRLAHAQFYDQGIHRTHDHSGVLFFVSLAERYVEILADHGIHEHVGEDRWRHIVELFLRPVRQGDVVAGFVAGIEACGAAMAEHYPADPAVVEKLSDGLIEL